jgi:hypothetical protein
VGEVATSHFHGNSPPTLTLPRKGGGDCFYALIQALHGTKNRLLPSLFQFSLEKALEPQRRKEREGKSGRYPTKVFHLIGSNLYLHKHLISLRPLRLCGK